MPGILGKKLGMTQIFQEDGKAVPITIVQCEPNTITQIKTMENDGYCAMVLGYMSLKKPGKNKQFKFIREFRIKDESGFKKDDKINLEILGDAETVSITAVSKGKGFQGVMKRHHFAGGPASHGSHHKREPGSIGARAKPGRVHKGKRMAGRMGGDTVTRRDVPVVYKNIEKNLIGLKGQIPGGKNNFIIIRTPI